MRVRVRFRYRSDTGEVEVFRIDDVGGGPVTADHDRRHDRAAADIGRVLESHPLVEEIVAADIAVLSDRIQATTELERGENERLRE